MGRGIREGRGVREKARDKAKPPFTSPSPSSPYLLHARGLPGGGLRTLPQTRSPTRSTHPHTQSPPAAPPFTRSCAPPPGRYVDFLEEGRRLGQQLRADGAELLVALTHFREHNDRRFAAEVRAP